jgi:hypothetical protein
MISYLNICKRAFLFYKGLTTYISALSFFSLFGKKYVPLSFVKVDIIEI